MNRHFDNCVAVSISLNIKYQTDLNFYSVTHTFQPTRMPFFPYPLTHSFSLGKWYCREHGVAWLTLSSTSFNSFGHVEVGFLKCICLSNCVRSLHVLLHYGCEFCCMCIKALYNVYIQQSMLYIYLFFIYYFA